MKRFLAGLLLALVAFATPAQTVIRQGGAIYNVSSGSWVGFVNLNTGAEELIASTLASGLSASSVVCTNASKVLTSTCTSVAPSFGATTVTSLVLPGSTSGTISLTAAAIAGTGTAIKLPGGTVDFSATGGTSQVVKQTSAGGAFTVARLACADLSNAAASCSTDTSDAANISAGVLAAARGGAGTISGALTANGSGVVTQASASNLSDTTAATTWTPTLTCGTSGTVTLTTPTGYYQKIGKFIYAQAYLTVGSVSSPVGVAIVSLPVAGTQRSPVVVFADSLAGSGLGVLIADINAAAAVSIYKNTAGTISTATCQDIQAGTHVWIQATYTVQ